MWASFILAFAIGIEVGATLLACCCFRTSALAERFTANGIGANQMVVSLDDDDMERVPIANFTDCLLSIYDVACLVLYLCWSHIHTFTLLVC